MNILPHDTCPDCSTPGTENGCQFLESDFLGLEPEKMLQPYRCSNCGQEWHQDVTEVPSV